MFINKRLMNLFLERKGTTMSGSGWLASSERVVERWEVGIVSGG